MAKSTCGSPSLFNPRKNCGPTLYPTAKRNIRKNTALTLGEMVMFNCPIRTPASRTPVTLPRLNLPNFSPRYKSRATARENGNLGITSHVPKSQVITGQVMNSEWVWVNVFVSCLFSCLIAALNLFQASRPSVHPVAKPFRRRGGTYFFPASTASTALRSCDEISRFEHKSRRARFERRTNDGQLVMSAQHDHARPGTPHQQPAQPAETLP